MKFTPVASAASWAMASAENISPLLDTPRDFAS
eukprot:CAMPEP_0118987828 /NCGR_PEP_ID=MMETSP1173-20130426/45020_1 /TAXON_ID=1034831 /ORGANISM="Rhizochromulina marina cf, Strain CCMP1243" /LENGTH=32 /DNA_ID= /DNA_START= /DNA_END= /DNA_ORIENTATION=